MSLSQCGFRYAMLIPLWYKNTQVCHATFTCSSVSLTSLDKIIIIWVTIYSNRYANVEFANLCLNKKELSLNAYNVLLKCMLDFGSSMLQQNSNTASKFLKKNDLWWYWHANRSELNKLKRKICREYVVLCYLVWPLTIRKCIEICLNSIHWKTMLP